MCDFISIVSDGNRNIYFFDAKRRKELKDTDYRMDSHTSICDYYKLNEDKCNKYQIDPFNGWSLIIDQINVKNDFLEIEQLVNRRFPKLFGTDKDFQLAAVNSSGYYIRHFDNPGKELQLAAINNTPGAIKDISNPDKNVQLAAVTLNGFVIKLINDPDKDVQLAAVTQNGFAVSRIKNPDKDVQLASVNQDGLAIGYIKYPDKDVQMAAVTQNWNALSRIDNPDDDVRTIAMSQISHPLRLCKSF
ncbi:HEAT repeat domain-containing protein [Acinetobacter sp.]|uniref:HEAT repeat domain-containing protein n=1 Tax=Acinetobacter sp. TaxID=472 RepID=UPI003D065299